MPETVATRNLADACTNTWAAEPSESEVLLLWFSASCIFVGVIFTNTNFLSLVDNFGDSSAYMSVASALRRWDFHGVVVKQFWGLPYLMAAVSLLARVSDRTALLWVSFVSSLAAVVLAFRLWGGWVAALFAVLNFDWMQRSLLGGSEPLFMALMLGAFLAVRRERWLLAALLSSFATIVRPLGFFALAGIGLVLLWRREFRRLACAIAIGLAIAAAYALPFAYQFGDPLATIHSYQPQGPSGPNLFGVPFYAIIKGILLYPAPWTNLILTFGWILFVVSGMIMMAASRTFQEYAKLHPVEMIFAVCYLLAIFSYNFPYWARGNFPRFAIPVVPFLLLALHRWWPRDRRLIWALAASSPLLAAVSALGVRNVFQKLAG
jgi:hypothetical protein